MATNTKVECKIIDIADNPQGGQNVFIECKIGQRIWTIERWLNYDRPISMEEFKKDLSKTQIIPEDPKDMLAYVKEEADKPFTLEIKNTSKE